MDIVGLLITILVLCVVIWLALYLVDASPIPEPFKAVLHWLVLAIGIIWLISILLGLAGMGYGTQFPVFHFHRG